MNRIILTVLFGILSASLNAQSDCGQGYEMKNVMCDGNLTSECIPENYVCKGCWHFTYALMNGSFGNGMWGGGGDSYEECQQKITEAQEYDKRHKIKSSVYNLYNYRIYLTSSKFCQTRSASEEMSLKINSLIDGWEHDVRDVIRECMGYENRPDFLPVTQEWAENNHEAMRNIERLREEVNRYTNMSLSFLEKKFDEITKDIEEYRIATSGYRNQAKSERKDEKLKQEKLKQEKLEKERLEREKQAELAKRLKSIANENSIKNQLAKEKQKRDELLNNMKSSKSSGNKEKSGTSWAVQANENSIQNLLAAERQKKKDALSKTDIKHQVQKLDYISESTNNLANEKQNARKNEKGTEEKWVFMYTLYNGGMNYVSDVVSLNELGCIGSKNEYDCAKEWFLNKVLSSMENVRDGRGLYIYVGEINGGPFYSTVKMDMIQKRARTIKGNRNQYSQCTEVH